MKVVLDGVFNHASRGFLQFHDVLENGPASAYLDWWHIEGFPLGAYGEGDGALRYRAWWNLPALPKFDTDTPAVREFLLSVGEHWLRFGIDGWRLDVPNEIDDDEFWREFRRRCRAVNPEAYIVGELWTGAERWLQGDQFDAVMNYQVTKAVLGFVAAEIDDAEVARCGYGAVPRLSAQAFQKAIGAELARYHPEIAQAQLNLVGSHDTPRALTVLTGDRDALRLAYALLFVLPGAPCVYYGDELGLSGGHDPACRQGMPWDAPETWDGETLRWLQDLAALRHAHPALRTGSAEVVYAHHGVVMLRRRLRGDDLLVAVNTDGAQANHVALEGLDDGPRERLLGEGELSVAGGRVHARVPARRVGVFAL